jgi:hypothetical protein
VLLKHGSGCRSVPVLAFTAAHEVLLPKQMPVGLRLCCYMLHQVLAPIPRAKGPHPTHHPTRKLVAHQGPLLAPTPALTLQGLCPASSINHPNSNSSRWGCQALPLPLTLGMHPLRPYPLQGTPGGTQGPRCHLSSSSSSMVQHLWLQGAVRVGC